MVAALLVVLAALSVSAAQAAVLSQVGEQDYLAYNQPTDLYAFNAAQVGEAAPVGWYGNDYSVNADISWTHTFTPPAPGQAGTLKFGVFDIDSGTVPIGGVRDVVAGFWLNGVLQDDSFFLAAGPVDQACMGLYQVQVPASMLTGGSLSVRLLLQGPGLEGSSGSQTGYTPYNGAGLDFAALNGASVPEPGTLMTLATGLAMLLGLKRKRRESI